MVEMEMVVNITNYGNYVPGGGGGARGNALRHRTLI